MKDWMRCNDLGNDGSQLKTLSIYTVKTPEQEAILEHKEPAGICHVTQCTKRWESS